MLRQSGIAGELPVELRASRRDQARQRRQAPADDDPFGCERVDDRADAGADVEPDELRRRLTLGSLEVLRAATVACGDGRTAGHPLQAIAVEGADAREVVVRMAGNGEMAHLRVAESVEDLAVDDRAAADPGPEGEVDERLQAPCRAQATLCQCRGIDVGVEPDRDAEGLHEWADQGRSRPARLGRRRDRSVARVARPQLDRPERADPDRVEPSARGDGAAEEVDRRIEGLVRAGHLDAHGLDDLAGGSPDHADELGAACLYPAEHRILSTRPCAKYRLQISAAPGPIAVATRPSESHPASLSGVASVEDEPVGAGLTTIGPYERVAGLRPFTIGRPRHGWVKGRRLANRSDLAGRRDPVRTSIAPDAGVGHACTMSEIRGRP